MPKRYALPLAALLFISFGCPPLPAQSPSTKQAAPATIPALFLSDIHFDPLRDPVLVPKLDAAPASEWPAILATPTSPTQAADFAAVKKACPNRADDTDYLLWQSSLHAIRANDNHPRFIVVPGDLLSHDLDCRYRFLLPTRTHADFVAFAAKTVAYVLLSLRAAVPNITIYTALGNNDTACGGNKLDAAGDFLAATAPIVAQYLPPAPRAPILRSLAAGGYYTLPMAAPMRKTRLIVIDNMFDLTEFHTCATEVNYTEEAAQDEWLSSQLDAARRLHQQVWVLGHVPPGITVYSTYKFKKNICGGEMPFMALARPDEHPETADRLSEILAANSDIIHFAIFAHTHSDELALIQPGLGDTTTPATTPPPPTPGLPENIVPSVSPINGNKPSFLLATVDPVHATLLDYTVIEASNLTGIDAAWAKKYTFTAAYAEPDFTGKSVASLIAGFQADPDAATPTSQAYLANFFETMNPDNEPLPFWPTLACSLNHQTGPGFNACACAQKK